MGPPKSRGEDPGSSLCPRLSPGVSPGVSPRGWGDPDGAALWHPQQSHPPSGTQTPGHPDCVMDVLGGQG